MAPMSVVAFSLSRPDVILDRGTWAIERRERGRVAVESDRVDILAASTDYGNQPSMIHAQGGRGSKTKAGRIPSIILHLLRTRPGIRGALKSIT